MLENDKQMSDHDLLIRLDTRFEEFQKNHSNMFTSFTELVHKFMTAVESKADKDSVNKLTVEQDDLKKKVQAHAEMIKTFQVQKQTVITIGEMSYKTLAKIGGIILFVIAVYQSIKK